MTVSTQYGTKQISEAVDLIKQHKSAIRTAFGLSGTGFESKMTFGPEDVRRLQNSLGVNQEQAQLISELWPVYTMGYQDCGASSQNQSFSQTKNPVS